METYQCKQCGKPFERTRKGGKPQVHCSDACRKTWSAAEFKRRKRTTFATACAECGGPVIQTERGRPRRFCSDICKQRANNKRYNRARLPLKEEREKQCAHCGRLFTARRVDRIYCYDAWCTQAAYQLRVATGQQRRIVEATYQCNECGTEFTAKHPSARWCSKDCANRHWGRVRSRRRRPLSSVPYTDREIFLRDDWRCHVCGKKVKQGVRVPDPLAPTIDHLVPLSLGGSDEPSNVATAHWRCNREKGVKAVGEQLRLT